MHKSLILTASSKVLHCLQAAASAFNILFKSGGGSAVESVIPTLLAGLEGSSEQASQALEGLRVILGVRPQTLGSMVGALAPHTVSALQSFAILLLYQFHRLRDMFICRFPSCCGLRCIRQICTHLLLLQKWLVSCLVPILCRDWSLH